MNYLCSNVSCTACGACVKVCPKGCIDLLENELGEIKAKVDSEKCVDCKQCGLACHVMNDRLSFSKANHVYAAWSTDYEMRANGASGGVASQIYKFAIDNDIKVMGTRFIRKNGVVFSEINTIKDIAWARNSKYVYSFMKDAFGFYEKCAKEDKSFIFIGLPCQVAALRTYLQAKRIESEKAIFVDIICHGVPCYKFLEEHIRNSEKKFDISVDNISFRDNSDYILKYYNQEGNCIYSKNINEDLYFRAFMESLDYRDNCYECRYAREERVSDLTIGDYSGLGKIETWAYGKQMVSLVLCNTERGKQFVEKLNDNNYLKAYKRSLDEPFSDYIGNPQLHHPSLPHIKRKDFINNYRTGKGFDNAVRNALINELIAYYLWEDPIVKLKSFLLSFLSSDQKTKLKQILNKDK